MLACFHVQVQYAGQLQLKSLQRSKGKHNSSLKVAVQGLVLWPTPYTYIHKGSQLESQYGQEFPLLHVVQIGSGAHPTSYLMSTGGSFPEGKEAGV
jgi:hypothetical protein